MLLRRDKKSCSRVSTRFRRVGFESLEERAMLAGLPYGAMPDDTMEFMLGNVVVTPVFFESDGSVDPSTENWDNGLIDATKTKIEEGLQWWVDSLEAINDVHTLNFIIDWQYADSPVSTQLEPINRRSQDYVTWGNEFLDSVGFKTPSSSPSSQIQSDIRDFNDFQRQANNADWAFTIFVANSENDADDQWNGSGSVFSRAFAFSGGRMIVMPSGRPSSTVAHEAGHQGWALDEYALAGHYEDRRGYLDIQNINAADNPSHSHEDSIMSNGPSLAAAFAGNTSSVTSLEMVGWRDSDSDGVFDILDVPHSLSGSGKANGLTYDFHGSAKVQTLANQNGKLFGDVRWISDITLNKVDEVQYRIDGGSWIALQSPHEYEVDLDLEIPLPDASQHTVEIRTVTLAADRANSGQDTVIASSPVFLGDTGTHDSTAPAGISGFVYLDLDENMALDATDRGLPRWDVELRDVAGQLLDLKTVVEPDDYNHETVISSATPGVTLSAQGSVASSDVKAMLLGGATSTGSGVFGFDISPTITSTAWGETQYELRIDFDSPVKHVAIDAVAELNDGYGRLDVFDSAGNLLDRYTTDELTPGQFETMTLGRDEGDIAYAVAAGHASTFIRLDRLMFGVEAITQTDNFGAYQFPYLEAGDYYVRAIPPTSVFENVSPLVVQVTLADEQVIAHTDFGERNTAPWHNAVFPADVDGNGTLQSTDAFLLITGLRNLGIGPLPTPQSGNEPPPYYDAVANNQIDLIDAFFVIAALRDSIGGAGEGEQGNSQSHGDNANQSGSPSSGEGEIAPPLRANNQFAPLHIKTDQLDRYAVSMPLAAIESTFDFASPSLQPVGTPRQVRREAKREQGESRQQAAADRSLPAQAETWVVRDLAQLELEDAIAAISEEVDEHWRDEESSKKSSESELPLK